MNEKSISDWDQAMTDLTRTLPVGLYSFFIDCVKQGFTREESFSLTIEFFDKILPTRRSD